MSIMNINKNQPQIITIFMAARETIPNHGLAVGQARKLRRREGLPASRSLPGRLDFETGLRCVDGLGVWVFRWCRSQWLRFCIHIYDHICVYIYNIYDICIHHGSSKMPRSTDLEMRREIGLDLETARKVRMLWLVLSIAKGNACFAIHSLTEHHWSDA